MKKVILTIFAISTLVFTGCQNNKEEDPRPETKPNVTSIAATNQPSATSARIGLMSDRRYQEELAALKKKYYDSRLTVDIYMRDTVIDAYCRELKALISKYNKSQVEYHIQSVFILQLFPEIGF